MPDLKTLLLADAVGKAWSDEAREAAAEARPRWRPPGVSASSWPHDHWGVWIKGRQVPL